jgi:hypothetical protein
MAIEAPLSSYKKKNILIVAGILIGIGGWFAYDGYKNEDFIKNHTVDGIADSTLNFNKKAPPFMIGAGILLGIYFVTVKGKKIVAGKNGLLCGRVEIAYDAIEKINKTHFDKKGFFIVSYSQDGQNKELKLSDRTYDNLPAVLDQIVSKMIDEPQSTKQQISAVGSEIAILAELRKDGTISDEEFKDFTERFKLSSGEKAKDLIGAISKLHKEYEKGAMPQGNYHDAVWGLLDKIERKID